MRILLAHNSYRSGAPSGENSVFANERSLLESRGHEVITYERFNDDIDDSGLKNKIKLALSGAWSKDSYDAVSKLIIERRPDIAHFHNTFPLISPSAYAACRDHGIPVVQTLHNYRLICPGALLQRNGKPCEDCVGKSLLPALIHRCYRGSLPATGAIVWMLMRNRWRGTYSTLVNRYIALTAFSAGRLAAGGIPRNKIMIKPNFIPSAPEPGNGDGNYAAFIGRLSSEKGVQTLLDAWTRIGDYPLKIVGSGEIQDSLIEFAREKQLPAEFVGLKSRSEVLKILGRAAFIVIPSEWYEGFPMVALEAYASGTPIIASRIGSLAEIVKDGVTGETFTPADPCDLADKIKFLISNPGLLKDYRANVRRYYDDNFNEALNYEMLMDIYHSAIGDQQISREA